MYTSQVRKQARPLEADVEESDELYQTRMPSSVRRYRSQPPLHEEDDMHDPEFHVQQRRASRRPPLARSRSEATPRTTEALPRLRHLPLLPILVGMATMIVLVMSINLFSSWWQTYQNDIHYGRPRTYQMDAVVGHDDSPAHPTHFIFLNLNRHVEIIEIPGGDPSKTRIYVGPVLFGNGQDLTPVTGEIRDDNGRKDLVVHIQNQEILFINDGTTFHAQ